MKNSLMQLRHFFDLHQAMSEKDIKKAESDISALMEKLHVDCKNIPSIEARFVDWAERLSFSSEAENFEDAYTDLSKLFEKADDVKSDYQKACDARDKFTRKILSEPYFLKKDFQSVMTTIEANYNFFEAGLGGLRAAAKEFQKNHAAILNFKVE